MAAVTYIAGNTVRQIEVEDYEAEMGHDGLYSEQHPLLRYERIDGAVYAMANPGSKHGVAVGNIRTSIQNALWASHLPCRVFSQELSFHYHRLIKGKEKDFVTPDVMIACKGDFSEDGRYQGVPKFVVEVLSPSSMTYDRKTKSRIYAEAGVSEYWIVNPQDSVEIYYLEDGQYTFHTGYVLCKCEDEKEYNALEVLTLREYPEVSMTLGSIFEW